MGQARVESARTNVAEILTGEHLAQRQALWLGLFVCRIPVRFDQRTSVSQTSDLSESIRSIDARTPQEIDDVFESRFDDEFSSGFFLLMDAQR